jgi:hypothetical protein
MTVTQLMFDGAPRRILHGKMDKNNPKEKRAK